MSPGKPYILGSKAGRTIWFRPSFRDHCGWRW